MSNLLALAALAAIGLAVSLLPKYLVARVTAAAKGAVDERVGKALEDHRHELDHQLEVFRQALRLDQERFSRDYALFATRRNEVYASTFGLLERARGQFAPFFSLITLGPNFSDKTDADLREFSGSYEELGAGEKVALLALLDRGEIERAREMADALYKKVSLRRAHVAFRDFKNAIVLEALYYSEEVERALNEAHVVLASMSARTLTLERWERQKDEEMLALLEKADAAAAGTRRVMRAEMLANMALLPPPRAG